MEVTCESRYMKYEKKFSVQFGCTFVKPVATWSYDHLSSCRYASRPAFKSLYLQTPFTILYKCTKDNCQFTCFVLSKHKCLNKHTWQRSTQWTQYRPRRPWWQWSYLNKCSRESPGILIPKRAVTLIDWWTNWLPVLSIADWLQFIRSNSNSADCFI